LHEFQSRVSEPKKVRDSSKNLAFVTVLDGILFVMTNLERPEVEPMLEPAPNELTVKDIVVGDGVEAPAGATVEVHYLGVDYESGEEFDSSWGRGESINFPLQRLIKGWQEGIPGMKVGGRRMLICPPEMAYGPAGGGHSLSGRTLVFVIDLLGVN
jgi:peptidylprolyl isomerase